MSKSSLQQFLKNGSLEGSFLSVTVVKKITNERYIVGDKTSLAVLELPKSGKEMKIGSGIKLIKPIHQNENSLKCNPNFSPVKTLDYEKLTPTKVQLKEIEKKIDITEATIMIENYITLEAIRKMTPGTVIQKVTFLVTRNSRIISATSGQYQICGLKDIENQPMTINLYDKFINNLEVGKVFNATKIKKFNLKKDGEFQPRLATTKFSILSEALPKEIKAFENVKFADNSLDGTIIGFSNIICYESCSKHWNKLDEDAMCPVCTSKPEEANFDFKAELLVQSPGDEEEIKTFLLFKKHATMITKENTEDEVETKLAEFSGQRCTVEYDNPEDDDKLVILKRFVTYE